MGEYMILIYDAEEPYADAPPELWRKIKQSHEQFVERVIEKGGKVLGRQALEWTRRRPRSAEIRSPEGPLSRPRRHSAATT